MSSTLPTTELPVIPVESPGLDRMETLFRALADRTRLRILALLAGGEVCVCEIHEALQIPQPTASRHLAYLRRSDLVQDRREGLWVYYRIADADDRVVQTLLGAVRHSLAHVAGAERPGGMPVPSSTQPTFPCCGREGK